MANEATDRVTVTRGGHDISIAYSQLRVGDTILHEAGSYFVRTDLQRFCELEPGTVFRRRGTWLVKRCERLAHPVTPNLPFGVVEGHRLHAIAPADAVGVLMFDRL